MIKVDRRTTGCAESSASIREYTRKTQQMQQTSGERRNERRPARIWLGEAMHDREPSAVIHGTRCKRYPERGSSSKKS
jgi:hypothetical protein